MKDTEKSDGNRKITISKRLVAINSVSAILSKILNMTVLFWMYQYLLSRIPAEEFAILPLIMSIIVFAPVFFSFFTGGLSRYAVEAYTNADFNLITQITSSIFPLVVLMSAVFLVGGTFFALNINVIFNIPNAMHHDAQIMMSLLVISFCAQMVCTPFSIGFYILQRFVLLNVLGVARDLFRNFLILILLLTIGPKVAWVAVATFTSEIIYTMIIVIKSRSMVPELRFRPDAFDATQMRQLLGFGLWTTIGRLGNITYTNASTILLNLFGTAVDVTAYHIGATFFRQISSTIQLAIQPTQTILTSMHTKGDHDRFVRLVFRGGRYSLWASLIIGVPLTVLSPEFVRLYLGEKYDETATVITLFMISFPFTSPTAMLAMACMAQAKIRRFFLPAFLFQILGVTLMAIVAIHTELGAIGMAFSFLFITTLSQIVYFWNLCIKLTQSGLISFSKMVLFPGLLPAVTSLLVCLLLRYLINIETWFSFLSTSAISASIYVTILISFCLSESERADFRSIMKRVMNGIAP
jgi:O-antigen/teichoic acid export membrane protein